MSDELLYRRAKRESKFAPCHRCGAETAKTALDKNGLCESCAEISLAETFAKSELQMIADALRDAAAIRVATSQGKCWTDEHRHKVKLWAADRHALAQKVSRLIE